MAYAWTLVADRLECPREVVRLWASGALPGPLDDHVIGSLEPAVHLARAAAEVSLWDGLGNARLGHPDGARATLARARRLGRRPHGRAGAFDRGDPYLAAWLRLGAGMLALKAGGELSLDRRVALHNDVYQIAVTKPRNRSPVYSESAQHRLYRYMAHLQLPPDALPTARMIFKYLDRYHTCRNELPPVREMLGSGRGEPVPGPPLTVDTTLPLRRLRSEAERLGLQPERYRLPGEDLRCQAGYAAALARAAAARLWIPTPPTCSRA